jgi:hypothetical protein
MLSGHHQRVSKKISPQITQMTLIRIGNEQGKIGKWALSMPTTLLSPAHRVCGLNAEC